MCPICFHLVIYAPFLSWAHQLAAYGVGSLNTYLLHIIAGSIFHLIYISLICIVHLVQGIFARLCLRFGKLIYGGPSVLGKLFYYYYIIIIMLSHYYWTGYNIYSLIYKNIIILFFYCEWVQEYIVLQYIIMEYLKNKPYKNTNIFSNTILL